MRGADFVRSALARFALFALVACAGAPPVPTQNTPPSAAWFDRALDRSTEMVAVVDLASPRVDGSLRSAIVEALLAVFEHALGPGAELRRAVESASELTIAAPPAGDPLVILRDVAPIDPASLPASDGSRQFELGSVGELVEYRFRPASGSLFVLRDRTWIAAAGTAAQDLKNAFATGGAPVLPPRVPSPAVATLWVPAPSLRAIAVRERLKVLAPVLVRAASLEATLGEDDVATAHLHYGKEDDAKEAHGTLVDVVRAFARRNDPDTSWIGATKVTLDALTVTLVATVPPEAFRRFQDAH